MKEAAIFLTGLFLVTWWAVDWKAAIIITGFGLMGMLGGYKPGRG